MLAQPARWFERGQALPLLALAVVGLAAFTALAIDGGNLYTEQRRAQAAADNAVMAAAYRQMSGATGNAAQEAGVDCATVNANDPAQAQALPLAMAACQNASQNSYVSGPATQVDFHWPPVHGPYAGNNQYLEVVITQTVPTALAHLVYRQDPIPVTVIAVAHGSPTGPLMQGYAIASMKPDCPNSNSTIYINADGGGRNGGTFLTDGGAFVNANCPNALSAAGNHDGIITSGSPVPPISVAGDTYDGSVCTPDQVNDPSANCNFYPAPTTGVPQVPQDPLAGTPAATLPDCSALPYYGSVPAGNPAIVQPGRYDSLDSGNRDMVMNPGIYCLTGGTLSSGNGSTTGQGVLIYLTDAAAQVDYSGQGSVDLEAPSTTSTGCTGNADPSQPICAYLGILIYKVTGTNQCLDNQQNTDIVFTGNSAMNVVGLIYAPYSLVKYGGSGSLTMTGQTIAGCVKFNGNGNINIIYNPNDTYSPPPSVRLDQ